MWRRIMWFVAMALVTVGVLVLPRNAATAEEPAPAAYEKDIAQPGTLPDLATTHAYCNDVPALATGCFIPNGDDFWIRDDEVDGRTAIFFWQQRSRGSRSGECVNKLGAGHWGWCNKDFPEDADMDGQIGAVCDANSQCQYKVYWHFSTSPCGAICLAGPQPSPTTPPRAVSLPEVRMRSGITGH